MKFKTEVDLVNAFIDFVKNQYYRQNIEIFAEVNLGYGIADIVITNMLQQSIEKHDEKLNINDINIYDLISKHKSGINFNDISIILRSKKKTINDSLSKLLNAQFIVEFNGLYLLNNHYTLPFKNNFAIEAKLKDWKKALKQAYRYKWFAEYSFVVIDEYYSNKAVENLDIFKKYNIGLVTFSSENGLKRYYYPKAEEPYDKKMQMLLSEMVIHHEFAK